MSETEVRLGERDSTLTVEVINADQVKRGDWVWDGCSFERVEGILELSGEWSMHREFLIDGMRGDKIDWEQPMLRVVLNGE